MNTVEKLANEQNPNITFPCGIKTNSDIFLIVKTPLKFVIKYVKTPFF